MKSKQSIFLILSNNKHGIYLVHDHAHGESCSRHLRQEREHGQHKEDRRINK